MTPEQSLDHLNTIATNAVAHTTSWYTDFSILIILFAVVFFLAWKLGRGFFLSFTLSLYVAYALYLGFAQTSYANFLPQSPADVALYSSIAVYAVFAFIAFLILARVIVSDFVSVGIFGLIVLAFLTTGFLMALAYHVFPVHGYYAFTPAIDALFAPKAHFFWWFAAPLIGLFFLAR